DELSFGVARLRAQVGQHLADEGADATVAWLVREMALPEDASRQIVDYLERTRRMLGTLPTQDQLVLERFFDESGGMQLVLHAPFGSRLNRAWGLALRKRFCRKFNFELQAAATEDAIVLSLSTSHSFPLAEVARYLQSATAMDVLVQALLEAPLFAVRWRWNATTALALPRFVGGRKVAPQLQRMKSEDLLASVFPDQVACAENIVGKRELPDHPLVNQTLYDCLNEAMDAPGWLRLLQRIEAGQVTVLARDLPAPSPFAAEALQARPYAYLDDAPVEERRTQAVQSRRYAQAEDAGAPGQLDADAIASVRQEAWPTPRNTDEMHEALSGLAVITDAEAAGNAGWSAWLDSLAHAGRATRMLRGELGLWVAAEGLALVRSIFPDALLEPPLTPLAADPDRSTHLCEMLGARMGGLGPVTAEVLARQLGLPIHEVESALGTLQTQGLVLQGRFSPDAPTEEWCERHLLARIHRYTLKQLRREIEPVEARDFARFLFEWQHLTPATQVSGPDALAGVLGQLEGFEAPAALWESELLPARVSDYASHWLDELCTAGRTLWSRLRPNNAEVRSGGGSQSLRATPILLLPRRNATLWTELAPSLTDEAVLGSRAERVGEYLSARGASFFDEISQGTRLLQSELEDALSELVARGRVTCDSYAGLRALLVPAAKRSSTQASRRRRVPLSSIADAGRWSLTRTGGTQADARIDAKAGPRTGTQTDAPKSRQEQPAAASVEQVARILLRRYGVMCWNLLEREAAWLPPWRELVRIYRRLEARGEIRGGRFIAGLSGEQFALPEAIAHMRQLRRTPADGTLVCLAAGDPANLLGSIVVGTRITRGAGARVLYRDGVPVATSVAGQVNMLEPIAPQQHNAVLQALSHSSMLRPSRHPVQCATPVGT
ncbi:MAG: ATP-dependent DNA helicase, partial [Burkholderiaceae bacterium]